MDISSALIHALLPVCLVVGPGTTALTVGVTAGIAEATASITKVFSGVRSERIGRHKEPAAIGYGLAALTKPIFPLAPFVGWLVAARLIDRMGTGIRGAPRNALLADIAPPERRGAASGLRQPLDAVGACMGPLLAIGLMWALSDDFASVFWIAVIPAFMAFGLILFADQEPARPADLRRVRTPLARREPARPGPASWWVVGVAAAFTLAQFSEAVLILRAEGLGLSPMFVPRVLVAWIGRGPFMTRLHCLPDPQFIPPTFREVVSRPLVHERSPGGA